MQVYVRPFPDVNGGGPWQISTEGGSFPRWGPQGRELFYRNDDAVMVASVEGEPAFLHGRPEELFTGNYRVNFSAMFDVSPDGQQFLMVKTAEQRAQVDEQTLLVVVDNWFEELNRLAPPSP